MSTPMSNAELAQALKATSPRRLHPHSWLFVLLNALPNFIAPLIMLFWQKEDDNIIVIIFFAIALLFLIAALLNLFSYRLHIHQDDIVIYHGIFARNTRHVPLANLHNVNLRRTLLHRWLNVAEVRLETAGSGEQSEALLRVLSQEDALTLQRYLLSQQALTPSETKTNANLLSLSYGEIIRLGLSRGQSLSIFATLLVLYFENKSIILLINHAFNDHPIFHQMLKHSWLWLLIAIILIWLLGKLSSILAAFLGYSHFALYDQANGRIQQTRGLLTQLSSHIHHQRIQVWRWQQNPTLRLFKRYRLSIDTAVTNGQDNTERGIKLLVPIADQAKMLSLQQHWQLPWFDSVQPLAANAWKRIWISYLLQSLICCLIGIILIYLFDLNKKIPITTLLYLYLALIPIQYLAAHKRAAFAGWHCQNGYFFYRDGWLWRHWHLIKINNIQIIALTHTPFDRRHHMATLILDSMGCSSYRKPFAIRYLPEKTANALAKALLAQQSKNK